MIPKIIHYCWLSNDPFPRDLQKYMESWKKYLPDYELWLWDFNRFDINSSIWVKEAFEVKKYAFAADYIRCYALYNYGGIYLDMDVEVLKSFNDLLHLPYFLCQEQGAPIEAAVMGAEKHSKFFEEMIKYYENKHFVQEDGSFDTLILPRVMEKVIESNFEIKKVGSITQFGMSPNQINILPADWFSPKSYKTGKIHLTKNTYTIHHFSGSWIPLNERLERKFWQLLGLPPHRLMWHLNRWLSK